MNDHAKTIEWHYSPEKAYTEYQKGEEILDASYRRFFPWKNRYPFKHDKVLFIVGTEKEYRMNEVGVHIETKTHARNFVWGNFHGYVLPVDVEATRRYENDLPDVRGEYENRMSNRFFLHLKGVHFPKLVPIYCLPSQRESILRTVGLYLPHVQPLDGMLHGDVTTKPGSKNFWKQFAFFLGIGILVCGILAIIITIIFKHQ